MCGLEYREGGLYRNGRRAGWVGNNGYRFLSYKKQITIGGKVKSLGLFDTIDEARQAYLNAKPKE